MYQNKINITVFSSDRTLEESIGTVLPPQRLELQFLFLSEFSEDACRDADILVYDLPNPPAPSCLKSLCRKQSLLFYSVSREEMDALDAPTLEEADGWWERPLSSKILSFRLSKALKRIQMRKDYHLCRTYLDTVINSIPDLVWFKDLSGTHLKVNEAFCRTVGKSMDDIVGRGHCYIWNVSPDDPESGELICRQSEDIVIREKKTCQFTEKVKSAHGMCQFKTYKSPLYDEEGTLIGTVGIGHDITDLENMDTELEILLQSMPFSVLLCSETGIIINTNKKLEHIFGTEGENIIGLPYAVWSKRVFTDAKSVNSEGFVEAEVRNTEPPRILEIHESPIYDVFQNVVGHIYIYRDVTTERKLEAQILRNSNTDFLTGLYNRRCFYQYINHNRGEKPISLLYVDLDCFKKINDTYGHKLGDQALIITADVLRECFGSEFIARIGGDEFLIAILGACSIDSLKEQAQLLINRIRQTFTATPSLSTLSVSIGISKTDDPSKNIDQLIQESDAALYKAKQQGKSQYFIYPVNE